VRQILLAGEEAQKRPALLCGVIADRPAQHGVLGLERVENRALRGWTLDIERYLAADVRQGSQMRRKDDADHVSTASDFVEGHGFSRAISRDPSCPRP
jgi:hypothetical protein